MKKRVRILPLLASITLLALFQTTTLAQEPKITAAVEPASASASGVSKEEMERRIAQLEAQMEEMRAELNRLKQPAVSNNAAAAAAPSAVKETVAVAASQGRTDKPAPPRPGLDVGPVHVVPYGTIYFNIFGNSGGTNNADVPLFATPTGPSGFSATARETRLGLRLEGPQIAGAKSSGVFETDFSGGFPSIGIGEDFGVLRMRLAFMKLDWKNTTLVAGQDWTVFAPNNPVSLASVGAPEFAASGNLFARIPQIRLQQRWLNGKLSWDVAILGPRTGDYPTVGTTPAVLQPGTGAASRIPAFESRLALNSKDWLGSKKAGSIGISAHYGRARVATIPRKIDLEVVGVAGDWNMPFGKRVTLTGEAFFGRNLAGFQGAVFQPFVPDFAYRVGAGLVPGGPRAPGTRGGWAQLGFNPAILKDRLTLYGGFAIDDPRDQDFVSISRRDSRIRNRAFAFNFLYKLTPQLSWALEYRRLETLYIFSNRQNNNHLNLAAAYSF
ncbi:MAG TPA: bZIP transcription factor [Pyrinomonadaceae bacterium]|jgi:hypothetical protein|nr:bZIP transcription factor [Pyrinomonadaceae bacterium]